MSTQITTLSTPYALAFTTDATDTSFPTLVPTTTVPTRGTRGVVDCSYIGSPGSSSPNAMRILIAGTNSNNDVVTGMRVYAWDRLPGRGVGKVDLWIPVLLVEVAAVLGNAPGIIGTDFYTGTDTGTYYLADTITIVTGNANVSHEIVSPTADVLAHIEVDVKGAEKIEFTFDLGAGATGGQVLYKLL